MKSFFKSFLAVLLGNLIVGMVLMALSFSMLIVFIFALASESTAPTPDKAFLVFDLNTTISDTPEQGDDSLSGLLKGSASRIGLWDVASALDAAGRDKHVCGLFITGSLEAQNFGSGFAALAEVRRAIEDFKATGKPVVAYLDNPSLKNYYVAATADTIYLHPYAELGVRGMASESFYLGAALKKYGIGVQTTKVGKYKSAVEPFISDKMSDADREQKQALLDTLWGEVSADIATSRKTTPERIQALADKHGIMDADTALEEKLVDKIAYLDEVIEALKELGAEDAANTSFVQISLQDYTHRQQQNKKQKGKSTIAIVYAEGEIVDGDGKADSIGGDALAARLRQLRHDDDIVALVLRVNSPGGSAFASEVIQREVRLMSAANKPVVVSMGSLAASGGYWISAYADTIFAEKTTITGSIGVFGLMFNMHDLAANLGVGFDGVKTARFADLETLSRPKTQDELALLQKQTDKIYNAFLSKVAEGRKLERSSVERLAEGRVWAGKTAKRLGLVDTYGGLREAVAEAAKRAKTGARYSVRQYPERRTTWETFTESLQQHDGTPPIARVTAPTREHSIAAHMTRQFGQTWRLLENMNDRNGVYARLPYWEEPEK
ncbi:MAG: signal peptide peptidase SppA [Puniceicoccales bacterium]|jgi:protease-4|nr:signal peptide peptidase SppA [Puniceicoccales bacterium]